MTGHKTPPVDPDNPRVYAVSPTKEWRRCQCTHLAWRTGPNEWTCGCPPTSRCHVSQRHNADGQVELVFDRPFRFGEPK